MEVLEIDSSFDFNSVYKRHYCTLLNFSVREVKIKVSYIIDGVPKVLTQPEEKLFSIFYREWQHKMEFEFESGNYFSSNQLALDYFNNNLEKFGLARVSRNEAIQLAKENQRLQEEMKKSLI